jgi:hypothetical protein
MFRGRLPVRQPRGQPPGARMRQSVVRRQLLAALLVSALAAAAVLGSDRTAPAGGPHWVLDREHHLPGDPVFGWASIAWAHSPSLGRRLTGRPGSGWCPS